MHLKNKDRGTYATSVLRFDCIHCDIDNLPSLDLVGQYEAISVFNLSSYLSIGLPARIFFWIKNKSGNDDLFDQIYSYFLNCWPEKWREIK